MTTIKIQNLKCHGCANTITKTIKSLDGVNDLEVNVEESTVSFNSSNPELINTVKEKLSKLGYPEDHTKNTGLHKAKSFVSCATGKLNI